MPPLRRVLMPLEARCGACGLGRADPVAVELRELEIATRQLETLRNGGRLNEVAYEQVTHPCWSARRVLTAPENWPRFRLSPARKRAAAAAPTPAKESPEEIPEGIAVVEAPERPPSRPQEHPACLVGRHSRQDAAAIAPPFLSTRPPRRSLTEVWRHSWKNAIFSGASWSAGLLMVGCSIALVIYLWKDLEQIAYSKFLIFVGTNAAIFGAGLYALHRLKLQTTGRGLLLIATLLCRSIFCHGRSV